MRCAATCSGVAPRAVSSAAARSCDSSRSPAGQGLVDRVSDQRVHEAQRAVRPEHLDPGQRRDRAGRGALVQPGQGRRRRPARSRRRARRSRGRPRCSRRAAGAAASAPCSTRPRADGVDGVGVRGVRPDALDLEGAQQLPQQQRVARRRAVAGGDEGVVRVGAEPFPHQVRRRGRVRAVRGAPTTVARSSASSASSSSSGCCSPVRRVAATSTGSPSSRRSRNAEAPQRARVAPLQVVDRQHHRLRSRRG